MIKEKKSDKAILQRNRDLSERVKELDCLYGISKLVAEPDKTINEVFKEAVNLIPPGFYNPEYTCARIVLDGDEYISDNFRETPWKLSVDMVYSEIKIGAVEVFLLEDKYISGVGPFLREEKSLVENLARKFAAFNEQKRMKEKLLNSEERFRLAIQATNDGVWEWDMLTNQEYFSPRWCEIIGYAYDDPEFPHCFSTWADRIHPDDYAYVMNAKKEHFEKGAAYDVVYRHRHKSGEYRWQNSRGKAIYDENGKPVKMVGCIADITERKRAEEAIKVARSQLQATLDALPDLLFEVDAEGRIFSYHSHRSDLLAAPPEVFMGKRFADVLPPDVASVCQHAIYEAAQNGLSNGLTYRLALPQGERWFELSVAPMNAAAQPDQHFIMISRDITERKQLEDALRQALATANRANDTMNRLHRTVAHEFRTPLGLLTGSTDILDKYWERMAPEKRQEQTERIRSAALKLSDLVNSMMSYNKAEAVPAGNPEQIIDIGECCSSIAADVGIVWSTGHVFNVTISADCGTARLDCNLLRRVIENLLTNAFRYTPADGTVSLQVKREHSRLCLEISDSGIGIPQEDQSLIFDSFFRSRNVGERSGLGLGLSIVHEALSQMGGAITVKSIIGAGTTMRVEIPVDNPA